VSELNRIPAFFSSVSLSEAGAEDAAAPPAKRAQAQANVKQMIGTFLAETGWTPPQIKPLAGALMYSKYNFAIRFVMKRIGRKEGKPTDTSRNYEFTDWEDLDRTVDAFAEGLLETEGSQSGARNILEAEKT
jgi:menaquinone-dependent protoporphyrinogen oxidase